VLTDLKQAESMVAESLYNSVDVLGDNIFEISMLKRKLTYDLHHLIGFYVYAWAKCRMLKLYYDFFDIHFYREHFQV